MRTTDKGSTPGLITPLSSSAFALPWPPDKLDSCVANVGEKAPQSTAASAHVNEALTPQPSNTTYPEGGLPAWLVVLGSWAGMTVAFGYVNSIGTFNAYLGQNQLRDYDESAIAWIFSVFVFLVFFGGLQIGPVFDARGPRGLLLAGSACLLVSIFTLGLCSQYYQFMLNFALAGIGSSLVFTPAVAAIAHWFMVKRGTATGIATTGGSCGGVIFPLMLQSLFPRVGWAWSTRILGLIFLVLLIPANLLIRSRLPKRPATRAELLPDFRIFFGGSGALALTTMGIFFLEWGLFTPISYLTDYALASGISSAYSYDLIAVLNAGSIFGRWLPGYCADKLGRFNTMIVTVLLCIVATFGLWLPARGNVALVTVYAVVFGFASGSNISLTPICVGQLCETKEFGRYYATSYTIVSLGSLSGLPIAGALISATGGRYWACIVFTGLCYIAAFASFASVRIMRVGWDVRRIW